MTTPPATEHANREPGRASSAVGRAFGVEVEAPFQVPGIGGGAESEDGRRVRVELVPARDIDGAWPASDAGLIEEWHDDDGRLDARLDQHTELGYRTYSREYGRYLVSIDGTLVRCAPAQVPAWHWQRYLIGQALPVAALLQGLEIFHASAVSLEERTVAFIGGTRAGKSSVAVNLVLGGRARLLTDDVLVLERRAEDLAVHPGAGIVSVRHAEARSLGAAALDRLGHRLGDDGEAFRVLVQRERRVLKLGALYVLERGEASELRLEPISPPDPKLLLGSTFNLFVRTRARLSSQLDVCARLADSVPMFKALIPAGVGAAELARALESHARAAVRSSQPDGTSE